MIARNDLLPESAPSALEVFQLTGGPLPAAHLYMEAQVFTPDSARFLLHEAADAHGGNRADPRHRFLVCDLEDGGALSPLTVEAGAIAPSVMPDGRSACYFVDETRPGGGRLTLKTVALDGTDRRILFVLDTPVPGTGRFASRPYPLSTVRSDGRRLAISCFLGDGVRPGEPWGLLVFDLDEPSVEMILSGPSWCNVHPQYSRSHDPLRQRDILVQENHGCECGPGGEVAVLVSGAGADIHVVRDDGTDFRDMPWGRDGNEFCQGHQCWRGASGWAITSTGTQSPPEQQLIESRAVARSGHSGAAAPGGRRNHLSAGYPGPCFYHFGTDAAGRRLVTDTGPRAEGGGRVFLAALGEPGSEPALSWTCLVRPGCSWRKESHIHPFLSPDETMAFFNSDESGLLQAYMVRGLETLRPPGKPAPGE